MKKFVLTILIFIFLFAISGTTFAQEKIEINFFFSPSCHYCAQEKEFLNTLEKKYPELEIKRFNTFEKESVKLLKKLYQEYKVPLEEQGWVPITFTPKEYFLSFNEKIAKDIENCILECKLTEPRESPAEETLTPIDLEKRISLPIIGKINVSKLSPLALSIVLGALDGFNACAMVALGFLLSLLVATGIRKRVFLIGGVFILVSGIVYFIFISAWLNLFLVLEQIKLITYLVGIIIIVFSIFLLRDYFHGIICRLCKINQNSDNIFTRFEKTLFGKMERISNSSISLPLILFGVAAVAAGVNLVELVCSFGFPLAFTKILSSLSLPIISYYFYFLIYIIFYMLDDFIIFMIAVLTLRITQVSEKYLKVIKLISGIFLLLLGLIMLIKPGILMFGG